MRTKPMLFAVVLIGCSQLMTVLTTITAIVTTVETVLGEIQKVSDAYFAAHPDQPRQDEINELIDASRSAAITALDAARLGTDVGNQDARAALAQLQKTYGDLLVAVKDIGIAVAQDGRLARTSRTALLVPSAARLVRMPL